MDNADTSYSAAHKMFVNGLNFLNFLKPQHCIYALIAYGHIPISFITQFSSRLLKIVIW